MRAVGYSVLPMVLLQWVSRFERGKVCVPSESDHVRQVCKIGMITAAKGLGVGENTAYCIAAML